MPRQRRFAFATLLTLSPLLLGGGSNAQDFPNKPVRLVVASSPGSTSDLVARVVGPELGKALGQPVIVDNKPGAGQIIGLEYVARQAPADGYALAVPTVEGLALLPLLTKDLRFDPIRELPITAMLAEGRLVLGSSVKMPWKTFSEFVAHARANPGKLNYGTSSAALRVTTAAVTRELGLEVVHIPYSAGGPYIQALAAGQIDFGVAGVASAVSMGERFRVLTVSGSQRRPPYLEVPTFTELKLPPLRGTSYSINARAGTPRPVLDRLHAAATRVLQQPEVKTSLANIQLEPVMESIETSARGLADLFTLYTDTVRKAGIQPE